MKWIRLIVFSNIWIALAVASFITTSYIGLGINPDLKIILLVFFATILTYNFQRVIRIRSNPHNNPIVNWIMGNIQVIRILTLISGIGMAILSLLIEERTIFFCGGLAIVSGLYAYPFIRKKNGLRDLPYIKILLITLIWTGAAALPLIEYDIIPKSNILTFFLLEKAFFIIAITIPFDIRDLPYDSVSTKTIPQVIGVKWSLLLAQIFLISHLFFACLIYEKWFLIGYSVNAIVTAFLIFRSYKESRELYYTGIIDALPIFQLLVVTIVFYAKA